MAAVAVLATPTAAAASDPGPIQGGSTCYVVTVGPENDPAVLTVCPPDGS